ncbi:winged helix-turn-helix transcriptional regulator [Methanobrevibacter sp.]|uniref:winged helix-turn-helix transcriptional regulator n=1 Tax=Methanobrevibacter sp. TaxID=66852 RepID=UPI0025F5A22B|nr:winged helix-turn-helix transcriptional regulator [Methanobrevibacter sp.]
MEEQELVTKTVIDEVHNRTEYALTEKGLKTNRILYEITSYFFNELDNSRSEEEKESLLAEYREVYGI